MKVWRTAALAATCSIALPGFASDQPTVCVEPVNLQGPRPLQEQTAKAAVRDYLEAWRQMAAALDQNRPDLLENDFIGDAKDQLAATIRQQADAGVHSTYRDRSHDVRILFYSPEGLSIELLDTVDYEVQLADSKANLGSRQFHSNYIVVLTPGEVRWRVRIFQAQASKNASSLHLTDLNHGCTVSAWKEDEEGVGQLRTAGR